MKKFEASKYIPKIILGGHIECFKFSVLELSKLRNMISNINKRP